jgi:voltage-gated potassium channel
VTASERSASADGPRHSAGAERALAASGGRCPEGDTGARVGARGARLARVPRRERDEEGFEQWVAAASERADPFLAWLGLVFALLVLFDLTGDPGPEASRHLSTATWAIWGVFLLDYLVKLWLAPSRLRFLRRRWLAALMLLIPTLRLLRFVALLRVGRALPAARVVSSSYRARGTARRLLGSRLGYLGATSSIVILAVAQLGFLFERDTADTFESFGDALLWAMAAVIALQGDPVPETVGARLAMIAGFAFGLVIIASLAGTVGAYLIEDRQERAGHEAPSGR